jgi:hypothetical protein
MAVPSQDLTKLTMNHPTRPRVKQIVAKLRSPVNTYRIEEVALFNLLNYLEMKFASFFPTSEFDRKACAHLG